MFAKAVYKSCIISILFDQFARGKLKNFLEVPAIRIIYDHIASHPFNFNQENMQFFLTKDNRRVCMSLMMCWRWKNVQFVTVKLYSVPIIGKCILFRSFICYILSWRLLQLIRSPLIPHLYIRVCVSWFSNETCCADWKRPFWPAFLIHQALLLDDG